VIDWADKGKNYRCVIPRVMVSDRGAITLQHTANLDYELTFVALDYIGNRGYMLTDDPGVDDGTAPVVP
jgi:hypothetical protein